ncbi:MAG: hypothetical protein JW982_10750 [Spirochaetes bacterium]|nr:hypothetical protein [Spirochaetota bacterium]
MFETTIYLDLSVYSMIQNFSVERDISICKVIKLLLTQVCNIDNKVIITGKLTEYQNHQPEVDYRIFRYRLSEDEHKLFSSARHRLELSISKLLLIGFLMFFDNIFNINDDKQKYNYTIFKKKLYYEVLKFLNSIQKQKRETNRRE